MDFCKNCGAPVDDGETLCSACKAKQDGAAAEPVDEPAFEPAVSETEPHQEKISSEKTRQVRSQLLMGGVLIVAAIAVCLVVYFTQGRPKAEQPAEEEQTQLEDPSSAPNTVDTDADQTGSEDETVDFVSYTKDPSEVTDAEKFAVIATCAGEELTNQTLAYYYWYSYSSFINAYYTYVAYYGLLDTSAPLDEQSCYFDDSITWQQYFINNAVSAFAQFTLLCQRAEAESFVLPDDAREALDTLEQTLQSAADEGGFASIDAYLQEYYGAFADYESYYEFMISYYTALYYDDMIYNGFAFSDDEVSAYYDEHADELGVDKDDSLMINVRHILIQPETVEDVLDADGNVDEAATEAAQAEAKEAARAEAESLYEEWLAGDQTEDSFGNLAYYNSDDAGSYSNGGLYEDVYPGEMIAEFNDWCFDSARQPGDTGIVETDYGYHLMYFVGYGETSYWRSITIEKMVSEAYDAFFTELMVGDDSDPQLDAVVLLDPPGVYGSDAEEEETGEELPDETASSAAEEDSTS